MSEDKVEETKASYPDSGSVKDSRDSGSDESEEVIEGVGDGGLKLQVEAPLPKHLGQVIGHLWGISSSLGPVCQYQVLMDSLSIWLMLQGVFLSTPGLLPGCWSMLAIMARIAPLLLPSGYLFICSFFSNSLLYTTSNPLPLPFSISCEGSMACAMF